MIFILLGVLLVAAVFGPSLWVRWVMNAHSEEIPGMPGTGGELARHLVERFELTGVTVEPTEAGDHYDPGAKAVRLSPRNFKGKSLTAVAVAAHEVGHAIQHHRGDTHLAVRTRLAPLAGQISRVGVFVISLAPVLGLITRHPAPFSLMVVLGLSGLVANVIVHLITLPSEWDASFGKALPILTEGQYVAPGEEKVVAKILRAAALTYVAAALAGVLNLARWLTILLAALTCFHTTEYDRSFTLTSSSTEKTPDPSGVQTWHIAQLNIATALYPEGDPRIAGFYEQLDAVNALADESEGFVWRLQSGSGNATDIQVTDDPLLLVNMSVWESVEALFGFAYRSVHKNMLAERRAWFARPAEGYQVLWWVPAGHEPTVEEGMARLEKLRAQGPSPEAFTFKSRFPAPEPVGARTAQKS